MASRVIDLHDRCEKIARYLGSTFPTAIIERYEDEGRSVAGFRFAAASHPDVEFAHEVIESWPSDENGIAQELHMLHVSAELSQTRPNQRLLFTAAGPRREPPA